MARKKGRYSTSITKTTELNKTKPTEVMYTAINWKRISIVSVQKAQGTETTPTQTLYSISVAVAVLR